MLKVLRRYKMSIITISRGSYSKGKEVAEKVAGQLGYECISREVIIEASERFKVSEAKLIKAIHDAPSIFERISQDKKTFITYIQSAFASRLKRDNIVYHGLAGHLLLKGIPHVLKIRIIAEMKDRIATEVERENINEKHARLFLLKDDKARRKWTKSLYGVDPWDSSLYDLVIHIHKLTVDNAVDFICQAATSEQFKTTEISRQKMEDLALACQIKAALLEQNFDVSVISEYGNVLVYTKASDRSVYKLEKRVKTLSREIEGINNLEVRSGMQFPPDVI